VNLLVVAHKQNKTPLEFLHADKLTKKGYNLRLNKHVIFCDQNTEGCLAIPRYITGVISDHDESLKVDIQAFPVIFLRDYLQVFHQESVPGLFVNP
jgi:hypothetical protein